jgi:hypothetical protein
MPRLDDGQLANSANKFKKRRAWLLADDVDTVNANENKKSSYDATIILPASSVLTDTEMVSADRLEQDRNKTETRAEHDLNKSRTRLKQDSNKTRTRVEQSDHQRRPKINESGFMLKHESNKTETRPEHDRNMIETRLEHNQNMTGTRVKHEWDKIESKSLDSFFAFIVRHKAELTASDDDEHWLLLGLSDVQKRMFWHVAINCLDRGAQRTGPIEIKNFFSPLGISTDVVRTSLKRLAEKGILQREKGKLGKNGFAIISLPRAIHDVAKELFTNFTSAQAS